MLTSVIKLRKCIKCGHTKEATEYYRYSGNTCKECAKDAQKVRIAQKRLAAKKKRPKTIMDRYKAHKWGGGASVWINGVQVMKKGVLVGQRGKNWYEGLKKSHKKWLRRKRIKEKI